MAQYGLRCVQERSLIARQWLQDAIDNDPGGSDPVVVAVIHDSGPPSMSKCYSVSQETRRLTKIR